MEHGYDKELHERAKKLPGITLMEFYLLCYTTAGRWVVTKVVCITHLSDRSKLLRGRRIPIYPEEAYAGMVVYDDTGALVGHVPNNDLDWAPEGTEIEPTWILQ